MVSASASASAAADRSLAPGASRLDAAEAKRRAARVRLVLTDCDGVLTDTGVYYGDAGEVLKRFSIRDGMGVERLRNAGVVTSIITGETSPSVERRAEKLKLPRIYLGIKDKVATLDEVANDAGVALDEIAFIGDDVNDAGLFRALAERGLTGAPLDAMPAAIDLAHYRATAPGGHGAFRDFAEWILAGRS